MGDNETNAMLLPVTKVTDSLSKWTPEQLAQGIKDLESLPDWHDRETMLTELQFILLDTVSSAHDLPELMRRACDDDEIEISPVALQVAQSITFDMNLLAKELNGQIKEYRELVKQAADKNLDGQFELLSLRLPGETRNELFSSEKILKMAEERIQAQNDLEINPLFTSGRSKLLGMLAGKIVASIAGNTYRLQLMEESRCQTLRLALALEQYHREHNEFPDTLDKLGIQPMKADMSLQYQKLGAGYRIENKVFRLEK